MEQFLAVLGGALLGAVGVAAWMRARGASLEQLERTAVERGERRAEDRRREMEARLRDEERDRRRELDLLVERTRGELQDQERRLGRREDQVAQDTAEVRRLRGSLDAEQERLRAAREAAAVREEEAARAGDRLRAALLEAAGLSTEEATRRALELLQAEVAAESAALIERRVADAEREAARRATKVVEQAIQRLAVRYTIENTTVAVELRDDDLKGRIIGREGRNIRAIEKVGGVDLIIDDTPRVVTVSCFDPERREVARQAVERLVEDGRIQPARIEEVFEEVRDEFDEQVRATARKVLHELELARVDRRLEHCLGRLRFRTSYGQNQLEHAVEVAWLASAVAGELGLDPALARRCGLFHDIGKALDHEFQGGHPAIGADLLRRCGEPAEVVNTAAAHHGDEPAGSAYAVIAQVADAISAARPGARRDSMDRHIRRLEQMETLAAGFDGVDGAFAVQAGRELRVLVDARRVDDAAAVLLARRIAGRIAKDAAPGGEVKVTVIRETRVVEYAR